MTNEETKTEEISEVKKSDSVSTEPSVASILVDLVKKQDARIDSFEKRFDGIETLIKEKNANPVDSGVEAENKPKTQDANDVGDKVTIGNEIASSPKDQASIIAPALETSGTDKEGLKMENKADTDPEGKDQVKEEKKEEVAKTDDKEEKKEEAKDIEKSDDTYEIVKTVRPKVYQGEEVKSVPSGYQIIKAAANGWKGTNDETSSAEEALVIMYNKFDNGEFGNGQPQGAY